MGTPELSVVARARRRMHREALRTFTTPFVSRSDATLLVHCGHHKAGTVWIGRVMMELCRSYGLRYRTGTTRPIAADADAVFYSNAGDFQREALTNRPFRGSHLIRDPRDLVISGYHYHLVTTESWASKPRGDYGGMSYQAYLRSLPEPEGLTAEIRWFATATGAEMAAWDYSQPEFLELRYEDLLSDEAAGFAALFGWWGFSESATMRGLEIAERLSLANGGARSTHQIRMSSPGEWKERFSEAHIAEFKSQTGDLLVQLGYVADSNW